MTKIEETSRRTMNDGTVIVELKNTSGRHKTCETCSEVAAELNGLAEAM